MVNMHPECAQCGPIYNASKCLNNCPVKKAPKGWRGYTKRLEQEVRPQ